MLEVKNLTKSFNNVPVVKNVEFTIKPGEILGYLGPNGAGKSTTIKILAGLLEADEGSILYRGEPVENNMMDFKAGIGYIPEQGELYGHLSGMEYLQLVGRLREIGEEELNRKIQGFMTQFGLSVDMYLPISSYSKGMKQKILISSALLHNPDILLLDEPLSGLDVSTTLVFKELLARLAAMGKIIIYSSHILEVVERVCSRVIVIHKGKILADDSVDSLGRLMRLPSLESIFKELVSEEDTDNRVDRLLQYMEAGS